jgi:Holliday junction resolvase-like predicted endonuclease
MQKNPKSRGASNQQVGRAGEYFVVAELNKRGAFAVPFAGNMPKIDILACNSGESRTVTIQVKTKRSGKTWQASIVGSRLMAPIPNETYFWVFIDLGGTDEYPRYWILPDWWIKDDIYKAHQAYLNKHGGKRPSKPDSTHHAIEEKRLQEWQGRWEILGIFD